MIKNINKKNKGFVALIFVIMISSLFIVSSVIIAMVNTSNNMANYHSLESNDVMYNLDACLSDAMWQIASTTNASGDYSIAVGGVNCAYQISATNAGMKTVTSTATTSSAVGSWNRSVVMRVNVSSSPFFIQSHKDYLAGSCFNNSCCYDSVCNGTETCSSCSADCGACPVCGNGIPEAGEACDDGNGVNTDDCLVGCIAPTCGDTYTWAGHETCDDGNAITETQTCGNGSWEHGSHCNASCSGTVTLTEFCDYTGGTCNAEPTGPHDGAIGCTGLCNEGCGSCTKVCPDI